MSALRTRRASLLPLALLVLALVFPVLAAPRCAAADSYSAIGGLSYDDSLGADRGILPVGLDPDSVTHTTIGRLAGADTSLDGTLVSFTGEAVGEPIRSSSEGQSWILVQSGTSSVSSIEVLMPNELVELITHYRSYQVEGTTLLMTGVYHVADQSQTGTLDVTVYDARVVDEGGPVPDDVDMRKLWVGLGLTVVGLGVLGFGVYAKRRSLS